MQTNPILVERFRADVLESFHRGAICAVDKDKQVVFSVGDIHQVCYPRSALKLFQVLPVIESGAVDRYGFTTEEIAIMVGSHNGEKEHMEVVQSILAKIGLPKSELQCGAQQPTLNEDRNHLIKHDLKPEALHNNCSGKHAGFLALCKHLSYDTSSYLSAEHPIHLAIRDITAEMHDYPAGKIVVGIDGCSAPIFSLPVYNQALAYMRLAHPVGLPQQRQESIHRVVEAVTKHPYLVAGKGRYCTEMMQTCGEKVFGKTGADGVYSLGFREQGMGVCIKIDDGLMGPQYAVAQKLLVLSGLFPEETLKHLHHYVEQPILNWNKLETGWMRVNEEVLAGFGVEVA